MKEDKNLNQNHPMRFILIDDDSLNNTICSHTIKKTLSDAEVVVFTDPREGLEYIDWEYSRKHCTTPTVLFLDINMPIMDGWEFLDLYDYFDADAKSHIKIYIVAHTVDKKATERALVNKNVINLLPKPLTKETVSKLVFE